MKAVDALRSLALKFPETEESVVCNKSAFKAGGKGFLFIGSDDATYNVMVKLGVSLPEATKLQSKDPAMCKVGAHGWVTVTLPLDQAAPANLFERWVHESFQLVAPKRLIATKSVPPRKKSTRK
jgi:hypothetical protein